jgi:integrase
MRHARVRKIKPYTASRHAAGSYLTHEGISPDIIAAWLGHEDASFTMKTYVHARP